MTCVRVKIITKYTGCRIEGPTASTLSHFGHRRRRRREDPHRRREHARASRTSPPQPSTFSPRSTRSRPSPRRQARTTRHARKHRRIPDQAAVCEAHQLGRGPRTERTPEVASGQGLGFLTKRIEELIPSPSSSSSENRSSAIHDQLRAEGTVIGERGPYTATSANPRDSRYRAADARLEVLCPRGFSRISPGLGYPGGHSSGLSDSRFLRISALSGERERTGCFRTRDSREFGV